MNNEVTKINPQSVATTPAQLLEIAVNQGADIDRLEKLMDLQMRWEASEARKAYVVAMGEFRSNSGNITKNKQTHNSRYADLAHTLDTIKSELTAAGLSHSWKTDQGDNGRITVTCCVTHVLGHQECTSMSAAADTSGSKNSIQAIGSTVTYLQRYTLYSILGLASTDDDDGGAGGAITEQQAMDIQALFEEVGGDEKKFLANFKAESFEQIPTSQYKRAITLLEKKRAAK